MATHKKVIRKKLSKKVIRKKLSKKVAKKKTVLTNEGRIKQYSKRCEEKIAKKKCLFTQFEIEMTKIKRFSLGDIVNMTDCYRDYDSKEYHTYYTDDNIATDIKVKYKVAYVDSSGFPHLQEIKSNGEFSNTLFNTFGELRDLLYDGDDLSDFCFNNIITLDPDFIDSTIFSENYDPLAQYREKSLQIEKEQKEEVKAYYNLKKHNNKLRVYSGSQRGINNIFKKYDVGDTIWEERNGELTLKIKGSDILVFSKTNGSLITIQSQDLFGYKFYSEKPKNETYIAEPILRKYKPK